MIQTKKRQVAKKSWICNLVKGTYHKSEGWSPGYVSFGGENYSRVSLVATAVAKFVTEDGNYASLTIDDGTETIRLKGFGPDVAKIQGIPVGSLVRCVGKVRCYNDEIYLTPEIIRPLEDPNWLLVHKLQLGDTKMPDPKGIKPQISEQQATESIKEEVSNVQKKVLELIKTSDSGAGADTREVIRKSGLEEEEAKNILFGLLKAGDVYEPKKGRLKVLD